MKKLLKFFFSFIAVVCAVSTAQGDVVVSEFMSNPDGNDDGREWIEFYNTSNSTINLNGWKLADEEDDSFTFGSVEIGANDFIILVNANGVTEAQAKTVFETEWLGGTADSRVIAADFGSLSNKEDQIILSNASDVVQFSLAYGNDEDEDSTALLSTDFGTTSYGDKATPGINRAGDDNSTPGFLGFQDSGDWGSVVESDFNAVNDAGFLTGIGLAADFYDNVDKAGEADPLKLSSVSAVPEPSGMMVLLGLAAVGFVRRRKN